MAEEARLAASQLGLISALDNFVADRTHNVLFVVLPGRPHGKTYALTHWLAHSDARDQVTITVLTLTGSEARELLTQTTGKLVARALSVVRVDLRCLLEYRGAPVLRFYAINALKGLVADTLVVHDSGVFFSLDDEALTTGATTAGGALRSVWFIQRADIERAQRLSRDAERTQFYLMQ